MLQIGHGPGAIALLEHQQAQIIFGAGMALRRRLAIPVDRTAEIGRNAAAKLVGLTQIELRIGIAGIGERAPFGDRLGIIALLPGIDAGLHIGKRRQGGRQ